MPLDVDRLAEVVLSGTQALIAKAMAAMKAENDSLKSIIEGFQERMLVIEGQTIPALVASVESRELPVAFDPAPIQDQIKALQEALAAIPEPHEPAPLPDVGSLVDVAVTACAESLEAKAREWAAEAVRIGLASYEAKDYGPEIEAVRAAIPEPVKMPDLSGFATKAEVDSVRAAIPTVPDAPDLTAFATKAEVGAAVAAIRMPEVVHGKDGAGVSDVKQNADGELIVKLTNGETFNAGKVRGADGFGFDDLAVEDGEREFAIVFAKGDRTERFALTKSVVLYQGVWKEEPYRKGDAVTWAGSLWIAHRDNTDKPETSDAWQLAVKKGRDGKAGKMPEPRPETVKR